jgi:hypothetical protein
MKTKTIAPCDRADYLLRVSTDPAQARAIPSIMCSCCLSTPTGS